jgi:hypothetical protein
MNKLTQLLLAAAIFIFSVTTPCTAIENSPLADKLVAGSPWEFTTKYENTKNEFRYSPEGVFERWHNKKNKWVSVEITEGDKFALKTINDHTITYELDKDGNPKITHSKHPSTFRSLKSN